MKTLPIEEAKECFQAVCKEALSGEVIRFQTSDGSLLQLTPVPAAPSRPSGAELARCYDDNGWATFENHGGSASD